MLRVMTRQQRILRGCCKVCGPLTLVLVAGMERHLRLTPVVTTAAVTEW